jgi:hypothetical protein
VKTVKDKMRAKLRRSSKGALFIISDFEHLGTYSSVRKVIHELHESKELIRVYSGIYQKPIYSKLISENVPPLPSEIAKKYAQKNKWEIAPAGDIALNILGLDTQVPSIYEYISDGPNKVITLDYGQKIKFRHVQQREMKIDPTSSLVIEALKRLGKSNVSDKELRIIRSKLTNEQMSKLRSDVLTSRVWVRTLVKEMEGIDV